MHFCFFLALLADRVISPDLEDYLDVLQSHRGGFSFLADSQRYKMLTAPQPCGVWRAIQLASEHVGMGDLQHKPVSVWFFLPSQASKIARGTPTLLHRLVNELLIENWKSTQFVQGLSFGPGWLATLNRQSDISACETSLLSSPLTGGNQATHCDEIGNYDLWNSTQGCRDPRRWYSFHLWAHGRGQEPCLL